MFQQPESLQDISKPQPEGWAQLFAKYCGSLRQEGALSIQDQVVVEIKSIMNLLRDHHFDSLTWEDIFHLATGCTELLRADSYGDERVLRVVMGVLEIITSWLQTIYTNEVAVENGGSTQLGPAILTLTNTILERAPELCVINVGAVSELVRFSCDKARGLACGEVLELIKSLAKVMNMSIFKSRPEIAEKFETVTEYVCEKLREVDPDQAGVLLESLTELKKIVYPFSAKFIFRVTLSLAAKIPSEAERLNAALPVLGRVEDSEIVYPIIASMLHDGVTEEPVKPMNVSAYEPFRAALETLSTLSKDGCFTMFRWLFAYARRYAEYESTTNEILSTVLCVTLTDNPTKTSLLNLFNGFKEYVDELITGRPGYIDFTMAAAVLNYMVRLAGANADQDEILKLWQIYHDTCKKVLVSLNSISETSLFAQSIGLAILGYTRMFHQLTIGSNGICKANNDDIANRVIGLMSSPRASELPPESADLVMRMLSRFLEDAFIEAAKLARQEYPPLRRSIVDFAESVEKIFLQRELNAIKINRPFEFLSEIASTLTLLPEEDIHVAIFVLKAYHAIVVHLLERFSNIEVELENLGSALPVVLRFCGDLNFAQELVSCIMGGIEPKFEENCDSNDLSPDRIARRAIGAVAILAYNQDSSCRDRLNTQLERYLDQIFEALSSLDDIAEGEWIFKGLIDLIVFTLPRFEVLSEKSKQSICSLLVWIMDSNFSLAPELIFGADKPTFWYGEFGSFFYKYQQPSRITPDNFAGLLTFFEHLLSSKSEIEVGDLSVNCLISLMNVCSRVLLLGIYTGFWDDASLRAKGASVAKLLFDTLELTKVSGESFTLMSDPDEDYKRRSWDKIRKNVMQVIFTYYTFKRLGLTDKARDFARKFSSAIIWLVDEILSRNSEAGEFTAFAKQVFSQNKEKKLDQMFAFILQVSKISDDLEGNAKQKIEGFINEAAKLVRADNQVADDLTKIVNTSIRNTGYSVEIIGGCKFGTVSVDLMVIVKNAAGEEVLKVLVDVDGPSHTGFSRFSDRFKEWYLEEEEGLPLLRIDRVGQGNIDWRKFLAEKIAERLKNLLKKTDLD